MTVSYDEIEQNEKKRACKSGAGQPIHNGETE